MKTIYVDVDDVVAKTAEKYVEVVREHFDKDVSFDNLRTFDLKSAFSLTLEEFHHLFDFMHQPDVIMDYPLVDGAAPTIKAWAQQGHRIEIVTGRPTSTRTATLDWLAALGIPFDDFFIVDKYNRPGNDPALCLAKDALARRHYDLAVEDSPETALFLAEQMGVKVALMDRPWNLGCPLHENIVRCTSWDAVPGLL